MNYCKVKIELIMPMFFGVLCSLFFCALVAVSIGLFKIPTMPEMHAIPEEYAVSEAQAPEVHSMPKIVIESDPGDIQLRFLLTVNEKLNDPILEYFRVPDYREQVIGFFSDICPNVEIVRAILNNADKFDVPPALAFALSWEESRFNPNAVNVFNRDGSIDRGLFQLNNRSFPNIELNVFFDIDSNAYYGIAHLRHCLDSGGSVVSALAMYNAGAGRVRSSGTPEVTLDYISRILENQRKIEGRFNVRLVKEDEPQIVEAILIEEPVEIHPFYFTGGTLLGLKPKHIYSSW